MKKVIILSFFIIVSLLLIGCSNEIYEINFISNGGNTIESISIDEGEAINSLPIPVREGYDFVNWYWDESFTDGYSYGDTISNNMSLYAKWIQAEGYLKIGVILPDASEERWANQDGKYFDELLEGLGVGYGYDILFSEGDETKEIENAVSLIERGVEVIILSPLSTGGTIAALCEDEGVTLIAHDRFTRDIYGNGTSSADYFVTFNAWEIGKAQGQHLIDMAIQNGCTEIDPCDLAMFSGRSADYIYSFNYFGGAMEVLVPEFDRFNIINEDTIWFTYLSDFVDEGIDLTEENLDTTMNILRAASLDIETDWNYDLAASKAASIVSGLIEDYSNEDVYILAPNDYISAAIRNEFVLLGNRAYANMYITGQDGYDITIASLMGDTINGQGTQTMTVYKDVYKLVSDSVQLAKNIIDGLEWDTNIYSSTSTMYCPTVYTTLDVLLSSDPQATYDLIFATGYKDKESSIFQNIDFSVYE